MELVYNFYHGNSFGRSFVLVLFCCVFLLLLFLLVCCFLFVGLFSGVFFFETNWTPSERKHCLECRPVFHVSRAHVGHPKYKSWYTARGIFL